MRVVALPGVLHHDLGRACSRPAPVALVEQADLPDAAATVAAVRLDDPGARRRQSGRELLPEVPEGRVPVRVRTPGKVPGGHQHVLGPDLVDDTGVGGHPYPGAGD